MIRRKNEKNKKWKKNKRTKEENMKKNGEELKETEADCLRM
jgi:hypothetical protein